MKVFISKIIFVLPLAFAACNNQSGSNHTDSQKPIASFEDSIQMIRDKFRNADTVLLTGHLGRMDTGSNQQETNPPITINGKLNDAIITTRYILKKTEADSLLTNMLDTTMAYVPRKCEFNPHHAIILIKGKAISYINLCFDCQEFETSEDLKWLNKFDFKDWKKLESFYIKQKIRYYPPNR